MKKIGDKIQKYNPQERSEKTEWKFNSRRQELVQKFVDRINAQRKGTRYPLVSAKRLNSQYLWTMTTWELEVFYKMCDEYGNFGRAFFGAYKKERGPYN